MPSQAEVQRAAPRHAELKHRVVIVPRDLGATRRSIGQFQLLYNPSTTYSQQKQAQQLYTWGTKTSSTS